MIAFGTGEIQGFGRLRFSWGVLKWGMAALPDDILIPLVQRLVKAAQEKMKAQPRDTNLGRNRNAALSAVAGALSDSGIPSAVASADFDAGTGNMKVRAANNVALVVEREEEPLVINLNGVQGWQSIVMHSLHNRAPSLRLSDIVMASQTVYTKTQARQSIFASEVPELETWEAEFLAEIQGTLLSLAAPSEQVRRSSPRL